MSKCSFKGTFLDVTLWSNRPLWSAGTAQRVFARGKGTHPLIVPSSHIWLWLIWGLVATHSKHTYNGSSRQDYEGSESPQLNGVGWRRWSSSLAWALRVLQSLSVTSRCGSHDGALYDLCLSSDIGPPPPHRSLDPDTYVPSVLRTTSCSASFICFHLGSITRECASHRGRREGHLAEWLSHTTVL